MTSCLVCGDHDGRTALGGLRCNDCDGLSLASVVGRQLFALDASPTPSEPSSVPLGDASSASHRQATSRASRSVQPTDNDTNGSNGAPAEVSTRSTSRNRRSEAALPSAGDRVNVGTAAPHRGSKPSAGSGPCSRTLVLVDGKGKAYWRTDYLEEGE